MVWMGAYQKLGEVKQIGGGPQNLYQFGGHRSSQGKPAVPASKSSPNDLISVKSLSLQWDTSRRSVVRWLEAAGIQPIQMGDGTKGGIRYRKRDTDEFVTRRERGY